MLIDKRCSNGVQAVVGVFHGVGTVVIKTGGVFPTHLGDLGVEFRNLVV